MAHHPVSVSDTGFPEAAHLARKGAVGAGLSS
jgi:hypothetical protein